MPTYLRHGIYLCLVDEGAIFLDLSANAYLGTDAATTQALTRSLVGLEGASSAGRSGQDSEVPPPLSALIARGLLTESASCGRAFTPLVIAMTHALPFGTGRAKIHVRATHVLRFVCALICASSLVRRGRLLQLMSRIVTLKAQVPDTSHTTSLPSIIALVHIARRLSTLFYSAKDACLLDSVVLAEFLIRHGHRPSVIVGVRTKPFLAHAWVQLDAQVLNDSVEHAQTLTPIAAF